MIVYHLDHWPLIVTVLRGAPTAQEQLDFFDHFNEWLDRGERFATLRVYADEASLTRPQGNGQEAKQWFLGNSERIANLVLGMARVLPPEKIAEARPMPKIGVPSKTFADTDTALSWLIDDVFTPGGIRMKREPLDDYTRLAFDN